ncbi:uncharacterized protein LOC129597824 [Paramacrobiotus metropolitanus]|uniref:uncharacterized protein LOC129597824 n=1 Tax=Paramacrobiotus metropolitanus TaxID=2943436 RepID=UPI0024465B22|nr:uncharacterized protein LOC129597824 [Paramacrobiotus metropolitanus]
MQQWMNAFLTAAFYRGRLELAKQLAIRMDLYGMAVNIQKKLDERRDYHFWDYDAAATFVRREMRDDMKMQLKMREKSDTPLTNHPCAYASNRCRVTGTVPFINRHISICARKLPEVNCIPCRDCGLLLPPGAPDALHNLRHSANCERRTVVWTDDLLHTDVFEKPPFPSAGPLGQLYLVPADNVDRLVCQVFEHLADSGCSFMLRLSEVRRY